MKIALVNQVDSNSQQTEALKTQFDLDCLQPDEVVSGYDLVVYDASLNEEMDYAKTASSWMVVNEASVHHTLEYFRAGASGVLRPNYPLDSFKQCVETIKSGRFYLEPEMVQILAIRQIHKLLAPFTALSSREFDVFCLLAEECSIAYIARQLGISRKTAFNCQTQIKRKLGLSNATQMNQFAKKHGLI